MSNEISDLIVAMTELKGVFESKRDDIDSAVDSAVDLFALNNNELHTTVNEYIADITQTINDNRDQILNYVNHVYVDTSVTAGGDGSIGDPYSDVNDALAENTSNIRGILYVNLRIGQTHVLQNRNIELSFLQFQSYGTDEYPLVSSVATRQVAGDTNDVLEASFASLLNEIDSAGSSTSGLSILNPCRIVFHNLIIKTPRLEGDAAGFNIGLISPRAFPGISEIILSSCYARLGSPIAKMSSGNGGFNIQMHFVIFDIDNLDSDIAAINYVFVHSSSRPVRSHFSTIRVTSGTLTELWSVMFSHRFFVSGDPSLQAANMFSNINFSASAVPLT